jgi:3-dehydroquinate synthase
MKTVEISLGDRSYDIKIAPGLLEASNEILPWIRGDQVFIVTNEIVAPLYLEKVKSALQGKSVEQIILPDGEQTKSLKMMENLFDQMLRIPLNRSATVIALGGGVVGDMAGLQPLATREGSLLYRSPLRYFPRWIRRWVARPGSITLAVRT